MSDQEFVFTIGDSTALELNSSPELDVDVRVNVVPVSTTVVGIRADIKQALLNCFQHVAWLDGQNYYNALEAALNDTEVISISAVFTQGSTVIYNTDSLDSLKQYLVVTATYDDSTTADVTAMCTLSGELDIGTSTISVAYDGQSATFNVTVTADPALLYKWDFTKSLVDKIQGQVATVGYNDGTDSEIADTWGTEPPTVDSRGLTFTGCCQDCKLGNIYGRNRAYEMDISAMDAQWVTTAHARLLMFGSDTYYPYWTASKDFPAWGLIWKYNATIGWAYYSDKGIDTSKDWANGTWTNITPLNGSTSDIKNYFSGHTVRLEISSTGVPSLYVDGTLVQTSTGASFSTNFSSVILGSQTRRSGGGQINVTTITGFRVYDLSV